MHSPAQRQAERWYSELNEFAHTHEYVKGALNGAADALSRLVATDTSANGTCNLDGWPFEGTGAQKPQVEPVLENQATLRIGPPGSLL